MTKSPGLTCGSLVAAKGRSPRHRQARRRRTPRQVELRSFMLAFRVGRREPSTPIGGERPTEQLLRKSGTTCDNFLVVAQATLRYDGTRSNRAGGGSHEQSPSSSCNHDDIDIRLVRVLRVVERTFRAGSPAARRERIRAGRRLRTAAGAGGGSEVPEDRRPQDERDLEGSRGDLAQEP